MAVYRTPPDLEAAKSELAHATALQGEIWRQAVAAARKSDTPVPVMLLLPALNAMIDITTVQTMAAQLRISLKSDGVFSFVNGALQ
jgi:hypothetical protein